MSSLASSSNSINSRRDLTASASPAPSPRNAAAVNGAHVSLFVRTLRLLNLDKLPDWPGIDEQAWLNARDAPVPESGRLRVAEWVCYRLFELWDARDTKAKLSMFFPPYEPRQSVNLRSTMYQMLCSLKESGVLGKEAMLRKTMLDDFRGERFEEIMFLFSSAVLQKVVGAKDRHLTSAAKLALTRELDDGSVDRMAALSVAFKASLGQSIQLRDLEQTRAAAVETAMTTKEILAIQRSDRILGTTGTLQSELDKENLDSDLLKSELREAFINDQAWLNVIISGDGEHDKDLFPHETFHDLWYDPLGSDDIETSLQDPSGLLTELETRVELQRTRLKDWRSFQRTLSKRNEGLAASKSPMRSPTRSIGRSASKRLSPQKSPGKARFNGPGSPSKRSISPQKADHASHPSHGKTEPPNDLASVRQASQGLAHVLSDEPETITTPVPSTNVGRDVLPHRTLTRQPKFERSSQQSTPLPSPSPMKDTDIRVYFKPSTPTSQSIDPLKRGALITSYFSPQPRYSPRASPSVESPAQKTNDADSAVASLANGLTSLSLSERTRQSMAFQRPEQPQTQPAVPPSQTQPPPATPAATSFDALAERTRQSMAQLNQTASKRPATHKKSKSVQVHPVNQFHTPDGANGSSDPDMELRGRATTVNDDYESVFQTRSKMRRSPPGGSPSPWA